jgi:NAD(P)-dependent dehydrogenase (short-subunit alcohol dehydrogenase family)
MASKAPIALILGAGANIGEATARLFSSQGWRVALVARSLQASESTETQIKIPGDFAQPSDIVRVFDKVKETFGIPSVVVYNGISLLL